MPARRRCGDLGDGVIGCGPRPPTLADRAEAERFERYLRGEMDAYEARVYAGLSLRQAAQVLGVEAAHLADVEHGRATADDLLRARLVPMTAAELRPRRARDRT